jgi:hypothetical protein
MRLTLILWVALIAISCSKSDDSDKPYRQWLVTKVEGPSNGIINQAVVITVYWPYSSGCDVLSKFEETRAGQIINIKALGYTSGGICTMDAGIKTKMYEFISSTPGTYELRFFNPDDSFIAHTVVIN